MEKNDFKIGGIAEQNIDEQPQVTDTKTIDEKPVEEKPVDEKVIDEKITDEKSVDEKLVEDKPVDEKPIIEKPVEEKPIAEKPIEQKPPKELNPEVQNLQKFIDETGLGIDEYLATKKDWDAVSDIDVLKVKIREENKGVKLTENQVMLLAGKRLGVDLSEGIEALDESDSLMLKIEANKARAEQKEIQQKYNTPLETEPVQEESEKGQGVSDPITLENGMVMEKKEYERLRGQYISERKETIDKLKSSVITLDVGKGDEKTTESFEYIYEESDKHSMLSLTESVPSEIAQMYADEEGNLNHKQLNEDLWWSRPDNRSKAISKLLSQARSKGIEEVMKQETNVNFETKTPEKSVNQSKPIYHGRDDVVTVKMQL